MPRADFTGHGNQSEVSHEKAPCIFSDDPGTGGKDLLDIARIALGAIRDEDLVGSDRGAAALELVFRHEFPEKGMPLLGAVPPECAILSHFIDSAVKGLNADWRQRPCYIPDAQLDNRFIGMGILVCRDTFCNVGEQIRCLKLFLNGK